MPSPPPWPRLLTPRRRRELAREVDEELRAHVALRAAENEREGMAPEDALADAHERFGDIDRIRVACLNAEDDHPIRLAGRFATRVGMLAVGFGAIALALALVQSVLLQPLRFADADRLVRFGEGWNDAQVQASTFHAWRDQSAAFDALIAFDAREYTLTGTGLPTRLRAMRIGERYFDVFGVAPVLGRLFAPDEVEATPRPVVLLSETLWETRFRRSPMVLGRTISLNGVPHTVVGVMPAPAQLSHRVDLWTLLPLTDPGALVYTIGRLRRGVDLEEARAEISTLTAGLAVPDAAATRTSFHPLHDLYATPIRATILLLLVVSGLILVLVWAAVFRGSFDRSPIGRMSPLARSRQAWGEAVAVASGAAVLGSLLAAGVHRLTYDALFERWGGFVAPPGMAVVGVVVALALATAVGLVVTQRMARLQGHPWRRWSEQALVAIATAATVVLLVVVAQQQRSMWTAPDSMQGVEGQDLYVANLALPHDREPNELTEAVRDVIDLVREVSGVEAASVEWAFPFHSEERLMHHEVLFLDLSGRRMKAVVELVGMDAIEAVRAPLVEGRAARFAPPEAPTREAVISAAFAARAWPGQPALGQSIDIDGDGLIRTVVGVIGDVPYATLDPGAPVVYIPFAEYPTPGAALIVRGTDLEASALSAAVQQAVFRVDPEAAVRPLVAVADLWAHSQLPARTRLALLSGIALLGLACVLFGAVQAVLDRARTRVLCGETTEGAPRERGLSAVVLGIGMGVALAVIATRELRWLGDLDALTVAAVAAGTGLLWVATNWIATRQVFRSL